MELWSHATGQQHGGKAIPNEELQALFDSAPFKQDGWDTALKALASATGSSRAQLVSLNKDFTLFNCLTDMEDGYFEEFVAIEGHRADVNYRVAAAGNPFEVQWEDHYDAIRAKSVDEAYLSHVRKWDAEWGAQVILSNDSEGLIGLAALHAATDGKTTPEQRDVLREIAPRVLSAMRLQQSVEHKGVDLLRGSLESIRSAAILLDGFGKVCAATRAAERFLEASVAQVRGGMLRVNRPEVDRALQMHIGFALSGGAAPLQLWLQSARSPVLLEVCSLPRADWNFGFSPRVIVTLKAPLGLSGEHADRLSAAFGLTQAEGEIVALLVQGHARQQIASIRGVSAQTVASQLRTIFVKCDVNREAELVSIARGIVEMSLR